VDCWIYRLRSLSNCYKGFERLEYRGYDSAGVMLYDGEDLKYVKLKVVDLEAKARKS
jgi:glucosamine--fructose-6-phosphate aminotransferase (isomerizing)